MSKDAITLQKELEILRLEREIRFLNRDKKREALSSKMPNMKKTIKEAKPEELDAILTRLRKEREAQSLIRDIRRTSEGIGYVNNTVSTEEPVESLYHFGIKGMKWGVRRPRGADGRVKKGEISKLSNEDLKKKITRLNLEKQYNQLTAKQKSSGRKFVESIIVGSAKQTLTNFVSKNMDKALNMAVSAALSKMG